MWTICVYQCTSIDSTNKAKNKRVFQATIENDHVCQLSFRKKRRNKCSVWKLE